MNTTAATLRIRRAEMAFEKRVAAEIAKREEFNGWSNRETWTINLWLTSNDSATYDLATSIAKRGANDGEAAAELESYFGDLPNVEAGLAGDLLNTAMARVNWREIAMSLRAE